VSCLQEALEMAAKKDLLIYQGDDHTWPLRLQSVDRTDPANPVYTPFDLNDYTLVAHIRTTYADDSADVAANMTFQITDAASGEANMILSSEESVKLAARHKWDLQIVRNSDDYITTLMFGSIKPQKEVTRGGD
jgi:hypothetical protein